MDIDAITASMDETDAHALLRALVAKMSARKGRLRSDGRGATLDVQLANGQEFRLTIEEL